jgi:hypothetical protein
MLKKKGKKKIIININTSLLYSENNIWSQRYKQWNRYQVRKPRLPSPLYINTRLVDNEDNIPKSFNLFVGKHNTPIFQALYEILDKFEKAKLFPEVLTLHGPSGSGKSAISKIFVNEMINALKFKGNQAEKWCLHLDAKVFKKDLSTFWSKVTTFAEPPLEKYFVTKYRLLIIDNFDSVPPSSQQVLKRIMESFSSTLKYLFVCPDPKTCMTGFVLAKSTNLRTRSINERDALQVTLMMLNQHRIGFERPAIKQIFSMFPDRSLSKIFDVIQEVFLAHHFVSKENVLKITATGKNPDINLLPLISQHRSIEPFERCDKCTLVPPCQHISMEELIKRGTARRKELPRYKTGSMVCPEFARYGYCRMFNKNGHCSLDHPKNIHVIKKFAVRCPQCTIIWPCNHCDFNKYRTIFSELIVELTARLGRIRSINVPEPAISLTRHLVRAFVTTFYIPIFTFYFFFKTCFVCVMLGCAWLRGVLLLEGALAQLAGPAKAPDAQVPVAGLSVAADRRAGVAGLRLLHQEGGVQEAREDAARGLRGDVHHAHIG